VNRIAHSNFFEVDAMKAAILHEFKQPLTIEEVARPKPDANEVLIEVRACGVCHSDLHVASGDWPQIVPITKKPLILGHEIAGRVVEKGAPSINWNLETASAVPWVHWTCGECEFCREGNENRCANQQITGVTVDGGYAEYVKAPANHALKIPTDFPASTPRHFLRRRHCLSSLETRRNSAGPTVGSLWRRRLGPPGRANRAGTGGDRQCH